MAFQLGIDRLLKERKLQSQLKNRRVAVVAHPASVDSRLRNTLDLVASLKGIQLTAAFGPQHGFRGEKQDNMMESDDYLDPIWRIPVYSLYGKVRRPTDEMMQNFDILLVDLQDVGTRIYTYLTTLLYLLEACAQHQKEIWILDRPNPAGRRIEGHLLRPGWESFVGAGPMPIRHGLTLGEAALWFKSHFELNVNVKVIKMKGYNPIKGPGYGWPNLSWVNPSPNAATVSMARCFAGTVLLEGTHLSEGRGTTRPLEQFGAPNIQIRKIVQQMEKVAPQWMRGCLLRPCFFEPTFHKHKGLICEGLQIHVDNSHYRPQQFTPFRLVILFLKVLRQIHPDYEIWRQFHYEYEKDRLAFDLICGGSIVREWIEDKTAHVQDLEKILKRDERHWRQETQSLLLYPSHPT